MAGYIAGETSGRKDRKRRAGTTDTHSGYLGTTNGNEELFDAPCICPPPKKNLLCLKAPSRPAQAP